MSEDAAAPLEKAPNYQAQLEAEPWRFDFYAAMRRLERSFPDRPRVGDVASRRDEYVALGEQPYLDFPASSLSQADRDGRYSRRSDMSEFARLFSVVLLIEVVSLVGNYY